jgi:hypothetical protein
MMSVATDGCQVELSEIVCPEQQPILYLDRSEGMAPIPTQQLPINQPQTTSDHQDVLSQLEGDGQSISLEFSDNAAPFQPSSTSDSRNPGNSKGKARTTIPLPSGDWILGKTIHAGKTGEIRIVRKSGTGEKVSQLGLR